LKAKNAPVALAHIRHKKSGKEHPKSAKSSLKAERPTDEPLGRYSGKGDL
jgi:hypothetical protein